jgi:branched-chain amino acid transport system permease protein
MNLQFVADGLLVGAMIGLGAIGVTLTYSILRFANFAHGEFVAFGAYATLGIALAIGALIIYPQTEWIKAIDLAHLAMR